MPARGISPLANRYADRVFRARMPYTVRIERVRNTDAGLDLSTGRLAGDGDRTTIYEGIAGLYIKRGRPIALPDGSLSGATVMGLIPRSEAKEDKPWIDDAFTILTAPDFAQAEVGQVFTIGDVTGGGRLGPIWEFSLNALEPDSHWDDGSVDV